MEGNTMDVKMALYLAAKRVCDCAIDGDWPVSPNGYVMRPLHEIVSKISSDGGIYTNAQKIDELRHALKCAEISLAGKNDRISDLTATLKDYRREIKQLRGQKKRLENMLFRLGAMKEAPCFLCGYNGEGYFDPRKHKCAAKHHKHFNG
jgi:hypothetical protein